MLEVTTLLDVKLRDAVQSATSHSAIASEISAQLSQCDLTDAIAVRTDFSAADLTGCVWDGAVVDDVLFVDAGGAGATLDDSWFDRATQLNGVDFRGTSMAGVVMLAARPVGANFTDVDLSGSTIISTSFEGALLPGANGRMS